MSEKNELRKFLKKSLEISLITILAVLTIGQLFAADDGKIQGTVVSKKNGDPLIGVNIIVEGTSQGSATDINGFFSINEVMPGEYTIIASYIGYGRKIIEEVNVQENKTTTLNFTMSPQSLQGDEVIVTAKALKNTEAVLLKDRQKAQSLSDAISAEGM